MILPSSPHIQRNRPQRLFLVPLLCVAAYLAHFQAIAADSPPPAQQSGADLKARFKEIQQHKQRSDALRDSGKWSEAAVELDKMLAILREVAGNDRELNDSDVMAHVLKLAAEAHEGAEQFSSARKLREEVLTIEARRFGKNHWKATDAQLALERTALLARLDAAQRRQLAEVQQLNKQVVALHGQGKFASAMTIAERVADTCRTILGDKHPDYAASLNNLALLYKETGEYAKAEPLYRKAVAIDKEALGEKHTGYAQDLTNLAELHQEMGDYAKAEPLYRQALAIDKDAVGEKHPRYATDLNNLAGLYQKMRDDAKAEPLYRQALAINKESLGEKHPDYASGLNNLAELYMEKGEYTKAEPLFRQALAIHKEVLGEKHPSYAIDLNNLAGLYKDNGDDARAAALYRRALVIDKESLGEKHPQYAAGLNNLALLYDDRGDCAKAEVLSGQALRIMRGLLDASAGVQSERQQLRMADDVAVCVYEYLSLALAANVPPERVYAEILTWKGAVSARQQAMRRMRQTLHAEHSQELSQLFDKLTATSRELSNESLVAPNPATTDSHSKKLAELSDRIEQLQQDLAAKSHEFRKQLAQQRRTPDEIRRALPPGTVLVDLLEYYHYSPPDAKGKNSVWDRRLTAFVIRPDMPIERVELGPVEPIREAIEVWRWQNIPHPPLTALEPEEQRTIQTTLAAWRKEQADAEPGQRLREWIWEKLQSHFPDAMTVLFSPDGATARFPWAALPGKKPETYLIEDTALAVVPVARLLPELLADHTAAPQSEQAPPQKPSLLVIGDVNYDADPGSAPPETLVQNIPRGTRDGQLWHWRELPGTRTEMVAIADTFEQQFPEGKLKKLRQTQATKGETVLQLSKQYRFLHFATHGFFAPSELKAAFDEKTERPEQPSDRFGRQGIYGFHPGLMSGIVLAGANQRAAVGKDDGILTALEVEELDLGHVQLAMLSACETGLGESAGSEGLLGLQRAFQVAGAQTVVATLWKINDGASRSLMIDFYENLWKKKLSRLEALRQAQLTMLREGASRGEVFLAERPPNKNHHMPPFYWAAFELSGDWR